MGTWTLRATAPKTRRGFVARFRIWGLRSGLQCHDMTRSAPHNNRNDLKDPRDHYYSLTCSQEGQDIVPLCHYGIQSQQPYNVCFLALFPEWHYIWTRWVALLRLLASHFVRGAFCLQWCGLPIGFIPLDSGSPRTT